jgi:polysaccharide biosynthesis/export protein
VHTGVWRRFGKHLAALGAVVATACSWLPTAGPTTDQVIDQATVHGRPQFQIVDVDDRVVNILKSEPGPSFHSAFGNDGLPPEARISVGDSVSVLIWEAGGNGLFSQSSMIGSIPGTGNLSPGSHPATIPDQLVMRDGTITIPFAGRVQAAGRTAVELEQDIRRRLQGKAVDPQVIARVSANIANMVTVSGDVVKGALIPVSPYGTRILDVIAAAGGYKSPDYETFVKLSRHGVTVTMPIRELIDHPAENIYAWPGDTLTIVQVQRAFEAFGATARNAEIPFQTEKVSLAQALARSAGLLDERADPAGVFLIRYEPASIANQLTNAAKAPPTDSAVPVVYHLDMKNVKSYFLAQRFPVRDKDVIYVADASSDTIQKFFNLIATLTNPVVNGIIVRNATQ